MQIGEFTHRRLRRNTRFLVIAGIGMDAEVVGDTNDGLKKAVGWLAYTEAGVRHLARAPQEGLHRAG